MTTLYGIPNCDTVKKARHWLQAHGIAHTFHDLRAQPVGEQRLQAWLAALGAEALLNRRSTTWKQLPEAERPDLNDPGAVLACLARHPTLVKRPLLEHGRVIHAGFTPETYTRLFNR